MGEGCVTASRYFQVLNESESWKMVAEKLFHLASKYGASDEELSAFFRMKERVESK